MKTKPVKRVSPRDAFLRYVRATTKSVSSLPGKTSLEVAELTAFSILVALDGEAAEVGPYTVRPLSGKGHEGADIAGHLHELIYQDDKT